MATKSQEFAERLDKLSKKSESISNKANIVAEQQQHYASTAQAIGNVPPSPFYGGGASNYNPNHTGQWTGSGTTYTTMPPTTTFPNTATSPIYTFDPNEALKEQITLMEEKIDVIAEKMDLLLEVIDYLQLEGKHGN